MRVKETFKSCTKLNIYIINISFVFHTQIELFDPVTSAACPQVSELSFFCFDFSNLSSLKSAQFGDRQGARERGDRKNWVNAGELEEGATRTGRNGPIHLLAENK